MSHIPVLYQEVLDILDPQPSGRYVDCTVGAGGHSRGILERGDPDARLLGLDLDPDALALAGRTLQAFGDRVRLVQGSYRDLEDHLEDLGWTEVDGILLDLGLSSLQLDSPEKGFSFREDGPLDMRFDPRQALNAEELVNHTSREDLVEIISTFGEERRAGRITEAILSQRPITGTWQLAEIIKKAAPAPGSRIHPATRTFQALRIAVNQELEALREVLPRAVRVLKPGGRLLVISFHSLEDREVKAFFRRESRDCICPPELPVCSCSHQAVIKELTRRPIRPEEDEIHLNPRARSARMRAAQKIFSSNGIGLAIN